MGRNQGKTTRPSLGAWAPPAFQNLFGNGSFKSPASDALRAFSSSKEREKHLGMWMDAWQTDRISSCGPRLSRAKWDPPYVGGVSFSVYQRLLLRAYCVAGRVLHTKVNRIENGPKPCVLSIFENYVYFHFLVFCVYAYLYRHICRYISIYVYICIYIHTYMYTWTYVGICVCVCVCMPQHIMKVRGQQLVGVGFPPSTM